MVRTLVDCLGVHGAADTGTLGFLRRHCQLTAALERGVCAAAGGARCANPRLPRLSATGRRLVSRESACRLTVARPESGVKLAACGVPKHGLTAMQKLRIVMLGFGHGATENGP